MSAEREVVVVGGSVAGCATAMMLARQGVRVTVLEKASTATHYKRMCTHAIQPGAFPVLARLGLTGEELQDAGAVESHAHVWTRWGWIDQQSDPAVNLRRERLDPLLRRHTAAEPGVDLRMGTTVTGVLRDAGGRVCGVRARTRDGHEETLRAPLVVAADGRGSGVARMAGVPGRVLPHRRIGYFGYFRGLRTDVGDDNLLWFLDPDVVYVFPNGDDLKIVASFVRAERRDAYRADPLAALISEFDGVERRPDFEGAQLVGKVMGKLDMPNVRRPVARPGLAFAGDAAQSSDPLWGVGVGFALQSAELLADAVGPRLASDGDVDAGLRAYRRAHRRLLLGHHLMTSDYSTGRGLNPAEKLLFSTAVHHRPTAELVNEIGGRRRPLQTIMTPPRLTRAVAAAARHRLAA